MIAIKVLGLLQCRLASYNCSKKRHVTN